MGAIRKSMELNPANLDAVAVNGYLLWTTGEYAQGASNAERALSGVQSPPPWYYLTRALNALREDRFFDAIDSLDRPKLAAAIADAAQKAGQCPALLVQVNTGEEPQKAGVAPQDADAFIKEARERYGLPVQGLMCIPPLEEEPAMHFALLAKIAARNGLTELSMGMSDDFETAIRFGATQVRVGSALFGARL